jgi:predicted O-methyltransferase YrrM
MPIVKNKWLRSQAAKITRRFIHRFMKSPVDAAHQEYTMIYSQHDNPGKPTDELIDLLLKAVAKARTIDLAFLGKRTNWTYPNPNEFPGEHYRLLAGLVSVLNPQTIIEIGTERGMSCISMKSTLKQGAKIHTFDVKPWKKMESPVLTDSDFDSMLVQHLSDLTDPANQEKFRELFEESDLIFMDAAKDGHMEKVFLSYFDSIAFKKKPILIVDDIGNWNMLAIWRGIRKPKMDVTSFGHFTGTGLVQL